MQAAGAPCLNSFVVLGDQVGQISKIDGAKCAVSIVNGPTKWRTLGDVKLLFGKSGTPKDVLSKGDFVQLAPKPGAELTVGQLVKDAGAEVLAFERLVVGEGIEKEEVDFAAEVMAQAKG